MKRREFMKLTGGTVVVAALLPSKASLAADETISRSPHGGAGLMLYGRSGGHCGPGFNEDTDVSAEVGFKEIVQRKISVSEI